MDEQRRVVDFLDDEVLADGGTLRAARLPRLVAEAHPAHGLAGRDDRHRASDHRFDARGEREPPRVPDEDRLLDELERDSCCDEHAAPAGKEVECEQEQERRRNEHLPFTVPGAGRDYRERR